MMKGAAEGRAQHMRESPRTGGQSPRTEGRAQGQRVKPNGEGHTPTAEGRTQWCNEG